MLAVVYMMIIIKEKIMWKKSKVGIDYVWENDNIKLLLKSTDRSEKVNVFIDYNKYNILTALSIMGFENELIDRKIDFNIDGVKGKFNSFYYIINKEDVGLFAELILCFLFEHDINKTLNDKFLYEN
jgi:hypothetical protein